ncbi:MAG: DeoR family transcriptional regulator [Parcubacteria group bacterium]|nr:DeoR family transcriptional regulator [Parcubacteria group bacterium]
MEDIFNTELGRKILALTKASFKVSDLISDLVLREKIKHQVLEVYKTFLIDSKNQSLLLKEIDILDQYFGLGGHLNLIREEHLKQLRNGFLVFKAHIILAMSESDKSNINFKNIPVADDRLPAGQAGPKAGQSENLNAKQKKILEKFNEKNTLKLSEIMELFPDVSERTVRNELTSLIDLGKITRDGRGNGSFYKLTIDSENQ